MNTLVVGPDGQKLEIKAGKARPPILKPCDRVLVVSVADGPDPSLTDDGTGHAAASLTPDEFDEQSREAQDRSRAAAEALISALLERGAPPDGIEALVIEGEPGPALCKPAQEVDAAAIVVGSRGRGGLKRAFLGSVSAYVVRNAQSPVVVAGGSRR